MFTISSPYIPVFGTYMKIYKIPVFLSILQNVSNYLDNLKRNLPVLDEIQNIKLTEGNFSDNRLWLVFVWQYPSDQLLSSWGTFI